MENDSLDLAELAKDDKLMADAVAIAKDNTIEWIARQDELISNEKQYVFRVNDEKVVTGHKQ